MSEHGPAFSETCRYYLARESGPMSIQLVDGCHDSPEEVAKAAALHERIFGARTGEWIMVELQAVPGVAVAINEDAAEVCRRLVAGEDPTGGEA